ncbi:hypothetical protein N7510_000478 [Penicillium lagena]|uniref:uncharacterized protein n=1 Tax=Penicillium lagena TaxID=94218 RepID=UPI0025413AC1|nr:uncharacterized protein N7510_000478 [Penicillium lagena]KAJ5624169.1 hypothetical protein N7510_000478 [Penicillium lagena]
MRYMLLNLFLFVPFVVADGWEDFTNNLATDLAPLITLFGEKLTKQFLSESITVLDNVIFALSPLGVLTAVVSVIRVCGGASLRAFVGRAQEGPGDAEKELLPCVSETTGELFNDADRPQDRGKSMEIGTLREALLKKAWYCKGDELQEDEIKGMPELDIPNLSLNKGIKRKSQFWFYCAAGLGTVMQLGVMAYAALTVFAYPTVFKVGGKKVDSYAFPMYIIGTTFLFIGMFFCAFILGHSSKQYYLYPNHPSKIYWLQPGSQDVGDQVFGAFLATYKERNSTFTRNMRYIKSTRVSTRGKQHTKIYVTLALTLIGFVIQFVGQRGLHASVILAQLGSTLFMAVIRTCLRTERMAPGENKLNNPKHERQLISEKQKELDCFAFHVDEIKSFNLRTAPLPQNLAPKTTTTSVASKLIQTRIRLAELTSNPHHGINDAWEDLPVRRVTRNLAQTIEATMDLLSTWSNNLEKRFDFKLTLECERLDEKPTDVVPELYMFTLSRSRDTGKWRMKQANLEAVLGLWTWSLTKSKAEWRQPKLTRLVGLSEDEAREEETDLYFQKWIFRQRHAKFVSAKLIDSSRQLFGFHPEKPTAEDMNSQETFSSQSTLCVDMDVLAVITDNDLETMAAQDIYIHFLRQALEPFKELGGHVDLIPESRGSWLAYNSRLEGLVKCFETSSLGSREDALLCIVPALKNKGLLPELAGDSLCIRKRTNQCLEESNFQDALSILYWLCQCSEGSEFERSVYALGSLCRFSLLDSAKKVRMAGFKQICDLVSSKPRASLFKSREVIRPAGWLNSPQHIEWWQKFTSQLVYLAIHISRNFEPTNWMRPEFESLQTKYGLDQLKDVDQETENSRRGVHALLNLLTFRDDGMDPNREFPDYDEQLGFEYALYNEHYAVLYFFLAKWIEINAHSPARIVPAYTIAARNNCGWAIQTLNRYSAELNSKTDIAREALIQQVLSGDLKAAQTLIENGANAKTNPKRDKASPLVTAADQGYLNIVNLLLEHGAEIDHAETSGYSALHSACAAGHFETAQLLLSKGADINLRGPDDMTPLMGAVSGGHLRVVRLLVERGLVLICATTRAILRSGSPPFTDTLKFFSYYSKKVPMCMFVMEWDRRPSMPP